MKNACNVLLIDDHQLIIEGYKNALFNNFEDHELSIDSATDCKSAYELIFKNEHDHIYDIIFLDISLPPSKEYKILSGEELGMKINDTFADTKIIVITSYSDNYRINNIFSNLSPEGFLLKGDISSLEVVASFKSVLSGIPYYSGSILNFLKTKVSNKVILDPYDVLILLEISNGSKMKDLELILPLTKSAIDKRKRLLRQKLNVVGDSDRDLILTAKERGFI